MKVCLSAPESYQEAPKILVPENCTLCGECVKACAADARQWIGRKLTVAEAWAEILKDRVFYEESKGGVTFSGGEPLMQSAFVEMLLERCHQYGIHSALDTCGFAPQATVLRVALKADLVLYDIKFVDPALHQKYAGVPVQPILDNLRALCATHSNVWIRVPIIPGINDLPGHLDQLAALAASLSGVRQVNVLPYHRTGVAKFKRLGETYRLPEVVPPSAEYMEAVAERFSALGVNVKING